MSDDSDFEPRNKRRRNIRCLNDSGSSSASSSIVTTTRKEIRRRFVEDSSDSDSESSIEARPKRRVIPRVTSDPESDSSGSVVVQRPKRPVRVVSDSSDDSDHGFEGSSSSQWETDVSDVETPAPKIQDTGVDSDSSDGQSEKCPICLISFTNQEIGTPESCDHLFCVDCIQEWSKNVNTCPVDRQEFRLILVRRNLNGSIYREIQVQPPAPQNEVDILEDPTFCEICGSSDREERMLLCDGCDLGFHMECLTPPLADIPPGAWFCNDCTPEDLVDAEIELYELQLLLDDANEVGRPRSSRRTTTSRLVPRTRQSERVRQRIANNRNNNEASDERPQLVSSTSRPVRRVKKKKRRKKPRYRVVYQIDSATGETIAVKKRRKKRRTKKKKVPTLNTVKKRLAQQLGICAPRNVPQNLPDVRTQPQTNNLHTQRYSAGIPTLNIFGHRDELDFVVSEDDDFGDGGGVMIRRGVTTRRRTLIKSITVPNSVSSSTDVLGSILDVQSRFHSKHTKFSIGQDGKFTMENTKDRLKDLNNCNQVVRQRPISEQTSSDQPTSSGHRSSSPDQNNTAPTSTVENSNVSASLMANIREQCDNPQDYTQSNLNTTYDVTMEEKRVDKKKQEDASENNTPRSGTPASESEIDIYSDIETVTTSKVDEGDFKAPSPLPATPNTGTDDDNNDSEPDMVIDTDKPEETAVTSTVDSNSEITPTAQDVSSTSEIQSQAIQSSNLLFDDKKYEEEKCDDDDSEDGCPNFSIYSKETITMAKTITEEAKPEENQENDQVGEVSSSPATKPKEHVKKSTGLYSDSEDESIVKKENSFGITDLRNMTEDISEEERSYTPCLDERPHHCIEGLDTEMISDEDRNDFDESHDLKTASDGDALEINAKESELDFTRPEDYEEGEIVDKSKVKKETKEPPLVKKNEETDKSGNKENENVKPESTFKKLSKSNKERNYRDKDRERSKDKDSKKDKKKEKRKEIERYDVRALIAEKPRRLITKDKFGRDVRRSPSSSATKTPPRRTKSPSPKARRSVSKARSTSRERSRKKVRKRRSISRSKSRSRSKTKKRRRSPSPSRERRRKSRSKGKSKKHRSRSRHRTRSPTPKRTKEWSRRHSRDWTPSLSRSRTPEPRHLTPSWTPPRIMDNTVKPHNLTVILTNDANKKKKEKKRKSEKKTKENERAKKRKRNERTPPPSKEVFASGDNILVSVSFNKDNETRDVSTKKKREVVEEVKKVKKDKTKKKKKNRDLAGVKPVAIIDLERSPFKELTPSPKDIIVLSDSDNEEARNKLQKTICDSSQQVTSPVNNYTTGPKTPPEPQVKFTLTSKQTQMRAISNPLHDPEDIEPTGDETQENVEHKGPNTPPEPPNSPPSSPDAYDPFEPTKSRSPTPEVAPSSNTLNIIDNNRDESITISTEVEKTDQTPDQKSHTPPLADVQPADSQSSIQVTPESSLSKSPERSVTNVTQPVAQTIPFSSSVPTSLMTSTPVNSLAPPRINILSTTLLAPVSIPQRSVLPNANATKPVRKSSNRNGSDVVDTNLGFDSPYSPGSSDYEDLFEPPVETAPKVATKTTKNVKSPSKVQNAFDALFGTSPFNKVKKQDKNKFSKKAQPAVPVGGKAAAGTKQVGVKIDEDNLKILDDLPNSAVEMQVKDKFLKKLNRQERVVEEVKLVLKPHYNKKHINKDEYKDILRRAVPKICHNKTGEINPTKIKNLIEAYVKKVRHSKKVTSSSSSVNPQKA